MIVRHEIRSLDTLPWPAGLGKSEYPELRDELRQLMGEGYHDPAAHELAHNTSAAYRQCVDRWLSETAWSRDIVAVMQAAAAAASQMDMLGQHVETADWVESADTHCNSHDMPYGARWRGGQYTAGDYLRQPILITAGAGQEENVDGRHRLAYLRLRQWYGVGPGAVLVQIMQ